MILFGHVIGLIGMALICLAFWFVTSEKYGPKDNTYLWTNLSGAVLLIISLLINFNLGSFLIEIFWIAISGKALWDNHVAKNPNRDFAFYKARARERFNAFVNSTTNRGGPK